MMNALREIEYVTEEEYAELEALSQTRHEYADGQIYAMAGASGRHNDLAANVLASLHAQLRGKGCKTRMSDQRLKVESVRKHFYPDVLVACPPLRYEGSGDLVLLDAIVIVEVLSPSTAEYDRGAKYLDYQQLPSLRHYLLVSQDRITVEHRWRASDGDWKTEVFVSLEGIVRLSAIECTLELAGIYEGLGIDPGLSLLPPNAEAAGDEPS